METLLALVPPLQLLVRRTRQRVLDVASHQIDGWASRSLANFACLVLQQRPLCKQTDADRFRIRLLSKACSQASSVILLLWNTDAHRLLVQFCRVRRHADLAGEHAKPFANFHGHPSHHSHE